MFWRNEDKSDGGKTEGNKSEGKNNIYAGKDPPVAYIAISKPNGPNIYIDKYQFSGCYGGPSDGYKHCSHLVHNIYDAKFHHIMQGPQIYHSLKIEGLSHPHFDQHKNYDDEYTHPINYDCKLSELLLELDKKKEEQEKRRIEKEKLDKIESEEKQRIVNTYKASSRLDKIKNKNNIKPS